MSVVTNADALSAFMQGKSRRFENGEVLTLPGGQRFTVTKITFRKVDKMPYLTFMARCLICSKAYTSVYSVQRLRNGQRLVRTCGCKPGHDVREGSWVPGLNSRSSRKRAGRSRGSVPRIGPCGPCRSVAWLRRPFWPPWWNWMSSGRCRMT